jgi:hypothetical protein
MTAYNLNKVPNLVKVSPKSGRLENRTPRRPYPCGDALSSIADVTHLQLQNPIVAPCCLSYRKKIFKKILK